MVRGMPISDKSLFARLPILRRTICTIQLISQHDMPYVHTFNTNISKKNRTRRSSLRYIVDQRPLCYNIHANHTRLIHALPKNRLSCHFPHQIIVSTNLYRAYTIFGGIISNAPRSHTDNFSSCHLLPNASHKMMK
jgi:hypothetical protein